VAYRDFYVALMDTALRLLRPQTRSILESLMSSTQSHYITFVNWVLGLHFGPIKGSNNIISEFQKSIMNLSCTLALSLHSSCHDSTLFLSCHTQRGISLQKPEVYDRRHWRVQFYYLGLSEFPSNGSLHTRTLDYSSDTSAMYRH